MNDDGNIDRRLRKILVDLTGVPESKLHPDAEMMRDLGIDGADAAEFMAAFAQEFRVDMSQFEFGLHFGPEAGFDPFRWLYQKVSKAPTTFVPISIRDLESVAAAGKWPRTR
jgi:acyl carrier protein